MSTNNNSHVKRKNSTQVNNNNTIKKAKAKAKDEVSTESTTDNNMDFFSLPSVVHDVPQDIIQMSWGHYRSFLEPEQQDEENEEEEENQHCEENGDIDEIQEVIDLLKNHVHVNAHVAVKKRTTNNNIENASSITSTADDYDSNDRERIVSQLVQSLNSIENMLPALLSMSYLHLGNHAISQGFSQQQEQEAHEQQQESKSNTTTAATDTTPDRIDTAKEYLEQSLAYFPWNASATSMLANYNRMNMLQSPELTCRDYELASRNASIVRDVAISLLEEDDNDGDDGNDNDNDNGDNEEEEEGNMLKEWCELLLLNGMSDTEFIGCDDDEEEEEDDEEKEEVNTSEQVENDQECPDEIMQQQDEFSNSNVEATAAFMAALLNSTLGSHDKALQYLRKFDVSHRVHPNVWLSSTKSPSQKSPKEFIVVEGDNLDDLSLSPKRFISKDGILPTSIYNDLCQLFSPSASYWQESNYNQRGYYSFFHDIPNKSESSTTTGTGRASNVIEDVVMNHLLPLAQSQLKPGHDPIVGFEWWVHTRSIQANLGHQLHFDTDEAFLAQEKEVTHPAVSSVLYLTGNNSESHHDEHPAGSTIIFNQTPDSEKGASKVWLSQTRDNSYMVFPGDHLHGVLPCPGILDNNSPISNQTEKENAQRLTFMVGFWTRNVPERMKERKLYGPCGAIPPSSDEHSWVKTIAKGYGLQNTRGSSDQVVKGVQYVELPCISPAWECIEGASTNDTFVEKKKLEIPKSLDHRFFVKGNPYCFRESLFQEDETF